MYREIFLFLICLLPLSFLFLLQICSNAWNYFCRIFFVIFLQNIKTFDESEWISVVIARQELTTQGNSSFDTLLTPLNCAVFDVTSITEAEVGTRTDAVEAWRFAFWNATEWIEAVQCVASFAATFVGSVDGCEKISYFSRQSWL